MKTLVQCKQSVSLCHIGVVKDHGGHLVCTSFSQQFMLSQNSCFRMLFLLRS